MTTNHVAEVADFEPEAYHRMLAAELVGWELPRRREDALEVLRLAETILQSGEGDDAPADPWLIVKALPTWSRTAYYG